MRRDPSDPDLANREHSGSLALPLSVLQWDIDPNDPNRVNGEHDVSLNGSDYRVWWQLHPSALVYSSIKRAQGDGSNASVVANLVYDLTREGVVAIYGSAGDFRPFLEAFRRAYGL